VGGLDADAGLTLTVERGASRCHRAQRGHNRGLRRWATMGARAARREFYEQHLSIGYPRVGKSAVGEFSTKMVSPRRNAPGRAVYEFGKRTCKPNFVLRLPLGALLRTLISDPTRGFGVADGSPCGLGNPQSFRAPGRVGRMRSETWLLARASLPILVLLRVGLPASGVTAERALLPHHFTLAPALSLRQRRRTRQAGQLGYCVSREALVHKEEGSRAVCFLWHWPSMGFEPRPGCYRHTACGVRTFLPRRTVLAHRLRQRPPVLLQSLVYRENSTTHCMRLHLRGTAVATIKLRR